MKEQLILTSFARDALQQIKKLLEEYAVWKYCPKLQNNVYVSQDIEKLFSGGGNEDEFQNVFTHTKQWGDIKFAPEFIEIIGNLNTLEDAKKMADIIKTFRSISADIETKIYKFQIKKIFMET